MDLEEMCSQEHQQCWQILEQAKGPVRALPGSAESTGFEQNYGQALLQYPCAQGMDHAFVLLAFPEILGLPECSFLQNTNQLRQCSVLLAQHLLVMSTLVFAHFMAHQDTLKNVEPAISYHIFQVKMTGAWICYIIIHVCFFTKKTAPQMLRGSCQEFCRDQGGCTCTRKSSKEPQSTSLCCKARQASSKGRSTGFVQ